MKIDILVSMEYSIKLQQALKREHLKIKFHKLKNNLEKHQDKS